MHVRMRYYLTEVIDAQICFSSGSHSLCFPLHAYVCVYVYMYCVHMCVQSVEIHT